MLTEIQKSSIKELIEKFKAERGQNRSEEHIQSLFTIKILEILNWKTSNFQINQGQDVSTGKKPDILLQKNGETLIVIESKDASSASMLDGYYQKNGVKKTFVKQLHDYCEAEGVAWGILTNFIEWRVYAIHQNRLYLNKKYAFHDLLWANSEKRNYTDLFSPQGFEFFEKLEISNVVRTKGQWDDDPIYYPVQEDIKEKFFEDLKAWRIALGDAIQANNKKKDLKHIEACSQKIIDRLIFIDYCADNKIVSQDRLHASLHAKANIYCELKKIFADMDEKFNSELFAESDIDSLFVPDDILRPIIANLADIDFSKLSVHVIGEVYEKYLGEIQRSGQGIFYTPEHIVDYIVKNTVGDVLSNCKSIQEIENVKVLDPACGSGSFLIRIFDEFLKHYKRFDDTPLFEFELRKKILLKNIYGVDLDERAIEIAKLNLLVKALEGAAHFDISGTKILPNIKLNIRCGNSIVSGAKATKNMEMFWDGYKDEFDRLEKMHEKFGKERADSIQAQIFNDIILVETALNKDLNQALPSSMDLDEVRPFNYEVAFPEAYKTGGFDCVIGNPPYIDSEAMTKDQPDVRDFATKYMDFTEGNWDIYIAFFDHAFSAAKENGYIGFITPDKWISKDFGVSLRKATSKNILSLMRAGRDVFKDAKVDSVVSIFSKKRNLKISIYEATQSDVIQKAIVRKTSIKPAHQYDYLFSKHVELLTAISDKVEGDAKPIFECENACATSDCYDLKPLINSSVAGDYNPKQHYKIINTGTIGKYISRWDAKEMTYLKDKYAMPIVLKSEFHSNFPRSYGEKAPKQKLILKGLTLLDATLDTEGEYIPGKTTLIITAKDAKKHLKYLCAFFNSKLAFFFIAEKYSSSSYNGGITFTKDMINDFPLIVPNDQTLIKISALVDDIMVEIRSSGSLDGENLKKKMLQISSIQRTIDYAIYKLYGLSESEIELIDGYTNKKGKVKNDDA